MGSQPISENDPFRAPTDAEISAAEHRLGMKFHPDYCAFLKGGSDVAGAILEPASILPNSGHLDLFKMVDAARNKMRVPKHLSPFVEDNGDYFCLMPTGEVVYWSHNGTTDEKWASIAVWRHQVCVERR